MKWIVIILVSITTLTSPAEAQKEDYVWVMGWDGVSGGEIKNGFSIDFNKTGASFEPRVIGYNFDSYSASICDEDGRLLFYTNGCAVLDSTGNVIENGDSLNYNEWFKERWLGDCRRLGYPGVQDVMILPINNSTFAILNKVRIYNGFAAKDSVTLHLNTVSAAGDLHVSLKDSVVYQLGNLAVGYLTACHDADQEGVYVLQPVVEDSIIVRYYVDDNGLSRIDNLNSGRH